MANNSINFLILLVLLLTTACSESLPSKEQLQEYTRICSDSSNLEPTNESIQGRFISINTATGKVDEEMQTALPQYLRASSADNADYLVCMEYSDEYLMGSYSASGKGSVIETHWYNSNANISIVNLAKNSVVNKTFIDISNMTLPPELSGLLASADVHNKPTYETARWILEFTEKSKRDYFRSNAAQRIISLDQNVTEILFAIGAGNQVVGRSKDSVFGEEYKGVPTIKYNSLDVQPILDYDEIKSQNPEMIIFEVENSAETQYEYPVAGSIDQNRLSDENTFVLALPKPNNLEGIFENMRTIAEFTGHLSETEALIDNLQKRAMYVESQVSKTSNRPLVLYQILIEEGGGVITPGPGSTWSTIIKMAGGVNAGDEFGYQYLNNSLGVGAEDNFRVIAQFPDLPDMIFQPAYTLTFEKVPSQIIDELSSSPGWQLMPAVSSGNIFSAPTYVGLENTHFVDILEATAKVLHPEIFE